MQIYSINVKNHVTDQVVGLQEILPEYLMWEVVFMFSCDPWWREPRRLQRLLQPQSEQGKAVLVQTEKHFCKLVHQAPRCPASDALERAGEKYDSRDLINKTKEEMFFVQQQSQMQHQGDDEKFLLCFSPPAQPGSTACRPPAPLWPKEAHLSSGVTAQSIAETQKQSAHFKTKWLIHKHAYTCKVLSCVCVSVCVYSQRTSMLTWLLEPPEIWATELLEVGEGVRKINYRWMVSNIYRFYFVTMGTYFTLTVAKHWEQCAVVSVFCQQRANLPQWNTAFTSRLSDKNRSGFRLRA